jgi:hypothetical protein
LKVEVESRNLSEVRVFEDVVFEGDLKTMKEHIDLELQSKKETHKDLRDIAGNLASVFTKKLQKWRQKQVKKRNARDFLAMRINGLTESESEVGEYRLGRRSCDTEPRFSVDAGRMSVEASRISFDEPPRASWDGYLIARTIPRLTPMLSVVEEVMLSTVDDNDKPVEDEHLHSIIEDETSSGGSGSGHTNSDSSSSQRRSSFDRSSSVRSFNKKAINMESDEVAKDSPAKLVITEKELKDWRLSTLRDEQSQRFEGVRQNVRPVHSRTTPNRAIKSSRWRKVCSKWGLVDKPNDNKCSSFASIQNPVVDVSEEGQNRNFPARFSRSSNCVGSRNSLPETSTKNVAETNGFKNSGFSHTDSGLLRLYLTPFKSYRLSKSGKPKSQESNLMSRNAVRLN